MIYVELINITMGVELLKLWCLSLI